MQNCPFLSLLVTDREKIELVLICFFFFYYSSVVKLQGKTLISKWNTIKYLHFNKYDYVDQNRNVFFCNNNFKIKCNEKQEIELK